jgi:hypothetical protein
VGSLWRPHLGNQGKLQQPLLDAFSERVGERERHDHPKRPAASYQLAGVFIFTKLLHKIEML